MGGQRSKEDEVNKISTSVFVTNFPDMFTAKELWNVCKQYGNVVDAYIPNRRLLIPSIGIKSHEVVLIRDCSQFTAAVSFILGIGQRYMDQRMNEAVKVAVQIQYDRLRDEAQAENEEFLKNLDENIQKIIKEQVKDSYSLIQLIKDILCHKDEEPSAGSYGGSKRRKEGNEPESTSAPKEKATRNTGKSTQGSKSQQKTASESAPAEEPMRTAQDLEEPSHQEFKTGAADDQPIAEASQHPEWFQQQKKPSTPDQLEFFLEEVYKATTDQLDWNNHEGQQYPHNLLKPLPLIPNSQGRHVIPFDHFINNDLEYLRGGASSRKYTTSVTKTKATDYGHIKWIEDLFYGFAINRESARDVYCKRRIIAVTELQIVEWHNYKHLDWITLTNLTVEERFTFNVSLRMFTRSIVIQKRVEDLQLGVESYQKKLNLIKPDAYRSDLKRKEAYTAFSNPRGFIYQNKDKQNRLMQIDELHKFNDGTLNDVRTALDDRLKGIQMKYLPQAIWRKSDKERAAPMIRAIDKQLKTRRIMRSLEKFVGGRLYEGHFRMLQRTI
uniref:UvrD-like helicase, ATP-binding domain, P-loop containing nucleoside triphosphate hydrolase n=1 Tax=Tanacetum cinerariifolium TaxID=118510 RepID=A0A6L2N6V7_TANCI|nr:UvrD-like helicase, ATP-binding domain, P-loop containing nucleoside triphosphate hydrolase [Tanacetum cinerariifolium]